MKKSTLLLALAAIFLLPGSCTKDYEAAPLPADPLAALPEALRLAVAQQGVANSFGTPVWEDVAVYEEVALTVPLTRQSAPEGWRLLLIAQLLEGGELGKAVILQPATPGSTYYEYGLTPDGMVEYRFTYAGGIRTGVAVPREPLSYAALLGTGTLRRSAQAEQAEVGGAMAYLLDEATASATYVPPPKVNNNRGVDLPSNDGVSMDNPSWWREPEHGGASPTPDPDPTPQPQQPATPCEKAQALQDDSVFKSIMGLLKGQAAEQNREVGYYYTEGDVAANGDANVTYVLGDEGTGSIELALPESKIDVFAHMHYGTDLFSIFTGADIYTLHQLLVNDRMSNPSTFTFGLVTGQGTAYLLMIDNIPEFNTFCNEYFGGVTSSAEADDALQIVLGIWGLSQHGSASNNEQGFLRFLNNTTTGLSLFKGDITNFNSWDKKGLNSNGNITTLPCQ